uniref:Uncharacterized protein n=1 Tax=Siphoviridae sp. ctiam3 TaxID=2825624 RepID=A0A8S5P5Q5_9CAUD|nr:MAG TPA: hypothetical protein [Siphoviridae sp. ctiam3]
MRRNWLSRCLSTIECPLECNMGKIWQKLPLPIFCPFFTY